MPPLALALITLIGAALVIVFDPGDGAATRSATPYVGSKQEPGPRRNGNGDYGGRKQDAAKYGGGKQDVAEYSGGKRNVGETAALSLPWLVRELGSPRPRAPLSRRVAPGFRVAFTRRGYVITYGRARFARSATRLAHTGPLQRFAHGVTRRTPLGEDTTVLRHGATIAYIVVRRHRGVRLWSWQLETNLRPRLRADGSLLLRGRATLLVQPPEVIDRNGIEVTPPGARWRLAREGNGWRLAYLLDDSRLPLPYAIAG